MNTHSLIRLPEVMKRTGYCRTAIYEFAKAGLFPRSVKIGIRAAAWPSNEVNAINAARVAGKSKEEIAQLVQTLHAQRKALAANEGNGNEA